MRLLVWNMNYAFGGQERQDGAWKHLLARADFDVALLQETREPPEWTREAFPYSVWRPKHADARRRTPWGCAVLSKRLELEPYEPDETFPGLRASAGATAIARVATDPTWLASVHFSHQALRPEALAEVGSRGTEVTTRNGKSWEIDVLPDELHRVFEDESFVWGGDLNSDERMDDVSGFFGGHRRMRDTWRASGAVSLRARFHDESQQTYFKQGSIRNELDHVFADESTAERAAGWWVDPEPATVLGLSDHAPILVYLKGPPAKLRGP